MTRLKKCHLWEKYPEVWELFEEFNDITQEDEEAWARLVGKAHWINGLYGLPEVKGLLIETVDELDRISRRRKGK